MHNFITLSLSEPKNKNIWVQQLNFEMSQKILALTFWITWTSWKTCSKNISLWISYPCNLKILLAGEHREELLFRKIVAICMSSFLTSFFADMSSFYGQYMGHSLLFLWWIYGNLRLTPLHVNIKPAISLHTTCTES
jgi:hypothetical protein